MGAEGPLETQLCSSETEAGVGIKEGQIQLLIVGMMQHLMPLQELPTLFLQLRSPQKDGLLREVQKHHLVVATC